MPFPDGIDALVAATRPLLEFETARTGYLHISQKFRHADAELVTRLAGSSLRLHRRHDQVEVEEAALVAVGLDADHCSVLRVETVGAASGSIPPAATGCYRTAITSRSEPVLGSCNRVQPPDTVTSVV